MQNFIHRTAPGTLAKAIPRAKNLYVSHGKRQSVQEVYFKHRNPAFIFDGNINPRRSFPTLWRCDPSCIRINPEMLRDFY